VVCSTSNDRSRDDPGELLALTPALSRKRERGMRGLWSPLPILPLSRIRFARTRADDNNQKRMPTDNRNVRGV